MKIFRNRWHPEINCQYTECSIAQSSMRKMTSNYVWRLRKMGDEGFCEEKFMWGKHFLAKVWGFATEKNNNILINAEIRLIYNYLLFGSFNDFNTDSSKLTFQIPSVICSSSSNFWTFFFRNPSSPTLFNI